MNRFDGIVCEFNILIRFVKIDVRFDKEKYNLVWYFRS